MSRAFTGACCCLESGRGTWGWAGAGDDKADGVEGVGRVRLAGPADVLGVKDVLLGVPAIGHNTDEQQ